MTTRKRMRSCSRSGCVSVAGAEIYYEQTGSSSNTLLCIPGALGTCRSDFAQQLDHLSDNLSVVAFDPRGYGKSQKTPRAFPADFFHIDASDGAELMKKLGNYSLSSNQQTEVKM